MAYRKIIVNDKTYEYTIGKTHTKVKGIGVVLNEQISVPMPYYDGWRADAGFQSWKVGPAEVKRFIEMNRG